MKNIVLIGFMGTGKSCVGRLLAEKTNFSFIDTDIIIENDNQMSIPEMFTKFGEPYFRAKEKEAIKKAAAQCNAVISTGGGVPMDIENMKILRETGVIICLCASVDTIIQRTKNRNNRPLLSKEKDKITALLNKRRPAYNNADFIIDTDDLSPWQIVCEIMLFLKRRKN